MFVGPSKPTTGKIFKVFLSKLGHMKPSKRNTWKLLCSKQLCSKLLTKFSNQIFEKEGLTGPQLLEEGCWERGGDFFLGVGVAIFTKINQNLKYLITKKVYK